MAEFETVQPNQLPVAAGVSGAAVVVVQEPGGPVTGMTGATLVGTVTESAGLGSSGAVIVPGLFSALGTSTIGAGAGFIHTTGNAAPGVGARSWATRTTGPAGPQWQGS